MGDTALRTPQLDFDKLDHVKHGERELGTIQKCQQSRALDPLAQDSLAAALPALSPLISTDKPTLLRPGFAKSAPTNPPTLSELRFLGAMEVFRSFGDQALSTFGVRLEAFRLQLQEISAENLQKLEESIANANSSDSWSLLKRIASALLCALSAVTGFALVSADAGLLIGGLLIASGIFSLANMLASEAGIWKWVAEKLANEDDKRRELLAWILPTAVGTLFGVIGAFGSVGAFAYSGIVFADNAILIAQAGLALFDNATTLGKGYADAKLIWSRADLVKLESTTLVERQRVNQTTKSVEGVLEGLNAAHAKSALLVRLAVEANLAVVQNLRS